MLDICLVSKVSFSNVVDDGRNCSVHLFAQLFIYLFHVNDS